jgi:outer membrane murein-binding lipoprotein Lpp
MEITSFILGVCAVIVLMMVVGTFVNYKVVDNVSREIAYLNKMVDKLENEGKSVING